jgi:hypothetical protein
MNTTRTLLPLCAALLLSPLASAQEAPPGGNATQPRAVPDNHMVREGDTLWDLSGNYLGSSYEWPRLWSYNPEITNPHWIYPGHLLRLREGADGGFAQAGVADGGPPTQARFGSGFGAMFNKDQRWKGSTVLIGEEVYLDKDALNQAGVIAGSPEEQMFLSPSDQIYIKFDKGAAPAVGKEMTIFIRHHRMEVAPNATKVRTYNPGDEGEIVRVLGAVKVDSYDDRERIAGDKKGVVPGNRFFVVRRGDDWRKHLTLREDLSGAERPDPNPIDDEKLPWEVVAELLVLYVRPQSCTALITASTVQVEPGDKVEMREGY